MSSQPQQPSKTPSILPPAPKNVPKIAPKIASNIPTNPAKIPPPIKAPAVVRTKNPPGLPSPPPQVKAPAVVIQSPPDVLGEEAISALPNLPTPTQSLPSDFEKQREGEDDDSYTLRIKYYQVAMTYLGDQISRGTAELFGRLAVNRVKEDVHYPSHVEEILNFLDSKM